MILARYDMTNPTASTAAAYAEQWARHDVTGHPPLPELDTELRAVLNGSDTGNPRWFGRDTLVWTVATNLLRTGRYDEAVALARVIAWCDANHGPWQQVIWEARPVTPEGTP